MSGVDTGDTYEIGLSVDSGKDNPRVFVFKNLTCRGHNKASALFDEPINGMDSLLDGLKIGLVGWRNVMLGGKALAYDPADLDQSGTDKDIAELLAKMLQANGLNVEQRKKLDALWESRQGQSAETAPALTNAKTPQQPQSQSDSNA